MSLHGYDPLITIDSVHDDGPLALYQSPYDDDRLHLDLGNEIVTSSSTDLAPLAKAILNAVEPDALVENQKDDPDDQRYVLATYYSTYALNRTRSVGILDTVTGEVAGFIMEDTPDNRADLQQRIDEGKAPGYAYSLYKQDIQRVTDEPTPTRRVASPKFPVGTRVKIVDDGVLGHRNGWTGRTGTVVEPNDDTHLFYDIRVEIDGPDGIPVQFYNTEVVDAPTHKHVEGLYSRAESDWKFHAWITPEKAPGEYTIRYLTGDSAGMVNKGMGELLIDRYTLVSAA